jgi:ribosomal-protein-alanine N-acetyltransferase
MSSENSIRPAMRKNPPHTAGHNLLAFDQVVLQTERLLLRPLRETDAPSLLAIFSDARFMQFGTTPPWASMNEARTMINRDIKAMASGERIRLGIERIEDDALIGICTLFDWDKECRSAEVGYGLIPNAWGRGYMQEALVALLDYGFSELNLNRVKADIDPRNIGSAKSLERVGFTKEGHLRENCIVNGELTDSALYGLLRREWKVGVNAAPSER